MQDITIKSTSYHWYDKLHKCVSGILSEEEVNFMIVNLIENCQKKSWIAFLVKQIIVEIVKDTNVKDMDQKRKLRSTLCAKYVITRLSDLFNYFTKL